MRIRSQKKQTLTDGMQVALMVAAVLLALSGLLHYNNVANAPEAAASQSEKN